MAVTYATAVKTARMTATRDNFQNGTLEIGTAGMATVLATFTLSGTAGTVATDTWTLAFTSSTVSAGPRSTPVRTSRCRRRRSSTLNRRAIWLFPTLRTASSARRTP